MATTIELSADVVSVPSSGYLSVGPTLVSENGVEFSELAVQPTPAIAGKAVLWSKNDQTLHYIKSTGVDTDISGSASKLPSSSTDEAIARFDGITGIMQDSLITVSDTGQLYIPNTISILTDSILPTVPGYGKGLIYLAGTHLYSWSTNILLGYNSGVNIADGIIHGSSIGYESFRATIASQGPTYVTDIGYRAGYDNRSGSSSSTSIGSESVIATNGPSTSIGKSSITGSTSTGIGAGTYCSRTCNAIGYSSAGTFSYSRAWAIGYILTATNGELFIGDASNNRTKIGTRIDITNAALMNTYLLIYESAAKPTSGAAKGGLWIKNDTPSKLHYVDDTEVEYRVSPRPYAQWTVQDVLATTFILTAGIPYFIDLSGVSPSYTSSSEFVSYAPSSKGISSVVDGGGGTIQITTTSAHGLVTGRPIQIRGCDVAAYDGIYIATFVDATNFTVVKTYTSNGTTGTVIIPVAYRYDNSLSMMFKVKLCISFSIDNTFQNVQIELYKGTTSISGSKFIDTGMPVIKRSIISSAITVVNQNDYITPVIRNISSTTAVDINDATFFIITK